MSIYLENNKDYTYSDLSSEDSNKCMSYNAFKQNVIDCYYKFDTTGTQSILYSSYDISQIDEIWINEVQQSTIAISYTFNDVDRLHKVSFVMKVPEGGSTSTSGLDMSNMFRGLTSLKYVDFSAFDQYVDLNYTFYVCTGLELIKLNGVKKQTGNYSFGRCSNLIYCLSDYISYLGSFEFLNCHLLKEIIIPENCIQIGNYAFQGTSKCELISIPSSVTTIGYAINVNSPAKLYIDCNVTGAANALNAPFRSTLCKEVEFGDNCSSIGSYSFNCSALNKITFGNNSNIDLTASNIFYTTSSWSGDLYFKSSTPPSISNTLFSNGVLEMNIYVPSGCTDAYDEVFNQYYPTTYTIIEY